MFHFYNSLFDSYYKGLRQNLAFKRPEYPMFIFMHNIHFLCKFFIHFHKYLTFSLSPESLLTLKIWVKDASSQRFLKGALVGVFLNGSQIHSSQTLENGEVTVTVPYHLGLTLTLVASMEGYVLTQLPWKTTKMPSKFIT